MPEQDRFERNSQPGGGLRVSESHTNLANRFVSLYETYVWEWGWSVEALRQAA